MYKHLNSYLSFSIQRNLLASTSLWVLEELWKQPWDVFFFWCTSPGFWVASLMPVRQQYPLRNCLPKSLLRKTTLRFIIFAQATSPKTFLGDYFCPRTFCQKFWLSVFAKGMRLEFTFQTLKEALQLEICWLFSSCIPLLCDGKGPCWTVAKVLYQRVFAQMGALTPKSQFELLCVAFSSKNCARLFQVGSLHCLGAEAPRPKKVPHLLPRLGHTSNRQTWGLAQFTQDTEADFPLFASCVNTSICNTLPGAFCNVLCVLCEWGDLPLS